MLRLAPFRAVLIGLLLLLAVPAQAARSILVFGDSLSAGYGIPAGTAWPTLLARRLTERKIDYTVVNASISGETTSGGLSRIDAALEKHRPAIVIIALGSNDGLRGLPVATMRDNLSAIVRKARAAKASVLIVGQRLPPNYGTYAEAFHKIFAEVARTQKTAFVDFLLAGVATRPELFLPDNLHPTAEAQPRLLDNVWRGLEPLLK